MLVNICSCLGTCTIAIVMIVDFPHPSQLPGGKKKGPLSDTSTYHDIWEIAKNVVEQCVLRSGQVGWQPAGMDKSSLLPFLPRCSRFLPSHLIAKGFLLQTLHWPFFAFNPHRLLMLKPTCLKQHRIQTWHWRFHLVYRVPRRFGH